jgi:hypothetical protein
MPPKGDSSPQNIKAATAPAPLPAADSYSNAAERPVRILPPPHARYQVGSACAGLFAVCVVALLAQASRVARAQGRHKPVHKYDVTAGKDMPAWSTSLFAFRDNVQVSCPRACQACTPLAGCRQTRPAGPFLTVRCPAVVTADDAVCDDGRGRLRDSRPRARCSVRQRVPFPACLAASHGWLLHSLTLHRAGA